MSEDERNPWPMVIFFALALGILWLIMDTLKPPASVKAAPVVAVDDGTAPTAVTATSPALQSAPVQTLAAGEPP